MRGMHGRAQGPRRAAVHAPSAACASPAGRLSGHCEAPHSPLAVPAAPPHDAAAAEAAPRDTLALLFRQMASTQAALEVAIRRDAPSVASPRPPQALAPELAAPAASCVLLTPPPTAPGPPTLHEEPAAAFLISSPQSSVDATAIRKLYPELFTAPPPLPISPVLSISPPPPQPPSPPLSPSLLAERRQRAATMQYDDWRTQRAPPDVISQPTSSASPASSASPVEAGLGRETKRT